MKHRNKIEKALRYLAASLVVAIGLITLVGSGGGWSIEGEFTLTASADSPHHARSRLWVRLDGLLWMLRIQKLQKKII